MGWSFQVICTIVIRCQPCPSRMSELHRKEAEKSVYGSRLPRARCVRFAGFHIQWCEYKAETSAQTRADNQASGRVHQEQQIARNYLKGTEGGQKNAMLSYPRHSMRITLKKIRIFCADFKRRLFSCIRPEKPMSFLDFRRCCPSA